MTWCWVSADSPCELLPDHVGRAGKEPVGVRVVGRPHDLVGADIIGQHMEAALDRLERDPAIAPEQIAGTGRQAAIVEALIVEMAVHAVEPGCDPAAARFEKADADLRVLLAHPAPDHREAGQHHLHRVGDDVARAAPREAVDADLRHPGGGALVKPDREIEILGRRPERLVIRVVDHLVVVGIGADEAGAEAEFLPREAHFGNREVDRLHRQHRDAEEAVGVGLAVIGEPAVVGAAGRGGQFGVVDRAGKEAEARIEKGGVDAVGIHVGDAGMRVEPARLAVLVFHRVGGNDALPRPDPADPPDAEPPVADRVLLDDEPLLAVVAHDDARRPVAKFRVDVLVPKIERLEDVTVGIDDVVGAAHRGFLRRRTYGCVILAQPRSRREPECRSECRTG